METMTLCSSSDREGIAQQKRATLAALGLRPSKSIPAWASARWAKQEAANGAGRRKAVRS